MRTSAQLDAKDYITEEEGNQRYAVVTLNQMAKATTQGSEASSQVLSSVPERK